MPKRGRSHLGRRTHRAQRRREQRSEAKRREQRLAVTTTSDNSLPTSWVSVLHPALHCRQDPLEDNQDLGNLCRNQAQQPQRSKISMPRVKKQSDRTRSKRQKEYYRRITSKNFCSTTVSGSQETVHHEHLGQTSVPNPLTLAECEVFSGVVSEAQPGVNMATDGDDSSRHSNFSSRTRDSNYMYRSSTISNKDENSREAYQYQSGDEGEFDGRQRTRKELRMLNFKNPGKFMDNFDPERSSREMRKMNRRIYKENLRKNQMYDEYGRYLDDLRDICDCLVDDCDGCFFPCTKCKSTKCGIDCRINRRYVYDQLEIEGSRIVKNFPDFQEQSCFYK